MGQNTRMNNRRNKLWKEDPHCRRCGIETILPQIAAVMYNTDPTRIPKGLPEEVRNKLATIEHLVPRFHTDRTKPYPGERTTLYCWLCNNSMGKKEHDAMPLEEIQRRAQMFHNAPRWIL